MPDNTLQLAFRNEEGSLFTISLANPRDTLTQAEVMAAMDLIIAKNIFQTPGGNVTGKVRARLISREVTEIASFL